MRFKISHKKYIIQDKPKEVKQEDYENDYVAESMGALGLWQVIYITIANSLRIIPFWNCISVIFLAPATKFVCVKFSNNATVEVTNNTCYENCDEYSFVTNVFEKTLITEFNLICEDEWKASFTQTVLMFGVLGGVSFYGWLSDRFGRRKALVTSGLNCLVFMFAAAFSRTYWTITILRFFTGIGSGGLYALVPVYISEIVGAKFVHTVLGITIPLVDSIGLLLIAPFAFFATSWRTFTLMYSSISILIVTLTFFLPETPRWLIAKNRESKAIDLMTRVAKFNGLDTSNIIQNVTKISEQIKSKQNNELNLTYFELVRTKKIARKTIASLVLWITTGFSYYGLLQYISQFGFDVYIIVCIFGVLHLISMPITLIIMKYCGRKSTCFGLFTTVGVISTGLIFITKASATAVVLGSIGVTSVTIVFTIIYIYVIELYPTPIRNMGLSFSSAGSKASAMVAPFVVNMMTTGASSAVFAALSFIAAFVCLMLPETKGKGLKDTIDGD